MKKEDKKNEVAVTKDITAQVLTKIEAFKAANELRIPQDYSPENALKSAFLILSETKNAAGKTPLDVCTKPSIANALLKMVVWGLSPMKKQCDFITYGDQLNCQPEYTGNIALAKRWGGMVDIKASAVFEGDEFSFETDVETGRKKIVKHVQKLQDLDKQEVVGAYAVVLMEDGTYFAEVMAMSQIKAAWNQGAMKGNSPAHKNFPDQMAIKTVINRACKLLIRGSDDSILYSQEDKAAENPVEEAVAHEVKTEANKGAIDFEEAEEVVEKIESPTEDAAASEEGAAADTVANKDGQTKAPF
jgi:recombination protein RecT